MLKRWQDRHGHQATLVYHPPVMTAAMLIVEPRMGGVVWCGPREARLLPARDDLSFAELPVEGQEVLTWELSGPDGREWELVEIRE